MKYIFYITILFTYSCGSLNDFAQTGNIFSEHKGHVEVYFDTPKSDYVQIGVLSITRRYSMPEYHIISELQNKARRLGANAILIQSIRDFSPINSGGSDKTKITAIAIRLNRN